MNRLSTLKTLSNLISSAVDAVDARCKELGLEYPSLNEPFNPFDPAEILTKDPAVVPNVMMLIAAADQLIATVRLPPSTIADLALGFHTYAALQAVTTANIPEILREAGPKGLHSKYIATKTHLDDDKISRFLRVLATHHVFRELEPDVWTNNRPSSMLDTMKSSQELLANPVSKHDGTPGIAALVEHSTDEVFKGSAVMTEVFKDPKGKASDDPTNAPVMKALGIQKSFFEWLETDPQNEYRRKRFNAAMIGVTTLNDPSAILKEFPWHSLPNDATVVDVGGGVGSVALEISKHYPTFKVVVQDLPMVIEQAQGFWKDHHPKALESRQVILQAHNFFKPQPVKGVDVFLLRMVTHDWSDSNVIKILQGLRMVAVLGKTKLLVVDQIAPYACINKSEKPQIPGPPRPPVPEPLLPNLGRANSPVYLGDLQMLVIQHGKERTLGNHMEVMAAAGWKIIQLYHPPGTIFHQIVAEPM